MKAAPGLPETSRLRDGTPVRWRFVVAADRSAFEAGFENLSRKSRYLRFQQDVEALPETFWDQLFQDIDQQQHIALILYAGVAPIAVCHVIRFPDDRSTADVAVTVGDQWQGRGAGSLLLREALAVAGDVRRIDTQVLLSNVAALQMLQALGHLELECVQGHCRVIVHLRGHEAAA